jgi:hypothetical protein
VLNSKRSGRNSDPEEYRRVVRMEMNPTVLKPPSRSGWSG